MCLLLFYVNPEASESELYLVLVSVRDEVYNRPTRLAEFWENHPQVIGGRDMEPGKEGGSWLVMSKVGKIGALLNILQPDEMILPNKKGRGFLVVDYVVGQKDSLQYLEEISKEAKDYNEFLLLTMDYSSLKTPKIACFTNSSTSPPLLLKPGIHAFGNSITPDNPWPKVSKSKEEFANVIKKLKASIIDKDQLVEELFLLLQDRHSYPLDESMKKQGQGKSQEFMDKLSATFVCIPEANYGSRCHTVILMDGSGKVDYYERSRPEHIQPKATDQWLSHRYSFKLHE